MTDRHSLYHLLSYYAYQRLYFNCYRNISVGEEIFTSYGEDDWFIAREIELKNENEHGKFEDKSNNRYHLSELETGAYPCLTDVFVDESNVPRAGKYDLQRLLSSTYIQLVKLA